MHMLGVMYAPTNRLTLMAMFNYLAYDMTLRTRMGVDFTTASQGLGDTRISALYGLYNRNRQSLHLMGVSIPTGSIEERDATAMESNAQLPYPMQTGSGTWDFLPGLTYLGQGERVSWGAQAIGTLRLGENARDYTLGNQLLATGWLAYRWNKWWSTSLRLEGTTAEKIAGQDQELNPMMVTTADINMGCVS